MTYVCYDIKGIQRFIFSVPKLKCIVGGSSLIDKFDSESTRETLGELIFAGGGRGAFYCNSDNAEKLKESLVLRAHKVGLDIQFGTDSELLQASRNAEEFFPYYPSDLSGHPCAISGLYPAREGRVNEMIRLRMAEGRTDNFGKRILQGLTNRLPDQLNSREIEFFRNVSPQLDHDDESQTREIEQRHAFAAQAALGNRNRWAVVAMDGNDIGSQFSAYLSKAKRSDGTVDDQKLKSWLAKMSLEMKQCTFNSVLFGLESVIHAWTLDYDINDATYRDLTGEEVTVLPIRPLILGGDDLVLLCHCAYAFDFVRAVAQRFTEESKAAAECHSEGELWPGSGNALSISAGVLFTNSHLPLHMAVPYAEDLLKNAKGVYRRPARASGSNTMKPTAAAIDFEVVTDSLLDSPTDRRRREFEFFDTELKIDVRLARRPYRLFKNSSDACPPRKDDSWEDLSELADQFHSIPPTVRAEFVSRMRGPWSQRVEFMASLKKRYPRIVDLYAEALETDNQLGDGWHRSADKSIECGVADAIVLLEEERRVMQRTS